MYEKLVASIKKAPVTMLGGLLATVVEACIEKRFFKDKDALIKYVITICEDE